MSKEQPESDDYALIQAVLAGDKEQFQPLVERYEGSVFGTLVRRVGDVAVAQELCQETFIRAYKGLRGYRNDAKFLTWITRIAHNVSNSWFESRESRMRRSAAPLESLPDLPAESGVAEKRHLEQQITRLRRSIAQLAPLYRDVVTLCSIDGRSYQEAAEILEVPYGTICSRMNVALKKLTAQLTDQEEHE
jgi:RNA polymerase sigma-70 factor (ECF subfamily)